MSKLEILKSLGILILIPVLAFSEAVKLEPHHQLVKEVVSLNRAQKYQSAIQLLADKPDKELKILRAMNFMAQYDEYSTGPSVEKAISILETIIKDFKKLEAAEKDRHPLDTTDALKNYQFWRAFAQMQMGLAYELKGNSVNGAFLTREGALQMGRLKGNVDAQGFHAIYEYYLGGITSKLPWVDDNRDEHLKVILKGIYKSQYFSDLFRTTAIWIHYDRKEYSKGLKLAQEFLKRYPKHRIFKTIAGDMHRKLKNYETSYKIYTEVYKDYSQGSLSKGVRSLSALGNIVLLKHYLGTLTPDDRQWKSFRNRLIHLEDKMPESLLDEMRDKDLID